MSSSVKMSSQLVPELFQYLKKMALGMLPLLSAHPPLAAKANYSELLANLVALVEGPDFIAWKPKGKLRNRRSKSIAPPRVAPRDQKRYIYSERNRNLQERHLDLLGHSFASIDLNKLHDEEYLRLARSTPLPDIASDEWSSEKWPPRQSTLLTLSAEHPTMEPVPLASPTPAIVGLQRKINSSISAVKPEQRSAENTNRRENIVSLSGDMLPTIQVSNHSQPEVELLNQFPLDLFIDCSKLRNGNGAANSLSQPHVDSAGIIAMDGVEVTIAPSPMDDVQQTEETSTSASCSTVSAVNVSSPHQCNNEPMVDANVRQSNAQDLPATPLPANISKPEETRTENTMSRNPGLYIRTPETSVYAVTWRPLLPPQPLCAFTQNPASGKEASENSKARTSFNVQTLSRANNANYPVLLRTAPKKNLSAVSVAADAVSEAERPPPSKDYTNQGLINLLMEARRKTRLKQDQVSRMFAAMFEISWEKKQDLATIVDHFLKHPYFGGGRKDLKKAIDAIEDHVHDERAWRSEYIVWVCKEALAAKTLQVQNMEISFIPGNKRIGYIERLFSRIALGNFNLMKEVNAEGCLAWEEMVKLAEDQERGYFNNSSTRDHFPTYQLNMRELNEFWRNPANMKKLVAERRSEQHGTTNRDAGSVLPGSPNSLVATKRKNDEVKHDDDRTMVQDLKRVRDTPTEDQERAAAKQKNVRTADSVIEQKPVKRTRDD
ncbi:hypothetical protein BKA66DRAFT_580456 [Pyrenochaeta sp. MPI-SDFR-AT-0127]|nr:hypothetical protein BKA66DRAFT_580456 [Pyrenochaeta sp. MPI-SDFR-AT-0127]